jgi:hypothetical protein
MGFSKLPKDLKNIVSGFAYGCKWETVSKDFQTLQNLRRMKLSSVFLRDVMWSQRYKVFIPPPWVQFEPICNYTGAWYDCMDWHVVQEVLWRLDFRLRFVKMMNTRQEWRMAFKRDWKAIQSFDCFYRFLLYTRVRCFKPIWKRIGFSQLVTYRSPFWSARWFLSH